MQPYLYIVVFTLKLFVTEYLLFCTSSLNVSSAANVMNLNYNLLHLMNVNKSDSPAQAQSALL